MVTIEIEIRSVFNVAVSLRGAGGDIVVELQFRFHWNCSMRNLKAELGGGHVLVIGIKRDHFFSDV
jgi:hypothetical protein